MMSSSLTGRRLCGSTIVSLVVVIALLVPPAVSRTDKERKGRDAQVIKLAASCASKCHDMCAALPKSEDPLCDWRCDSMSIFNAGVVDPAALHSETASIALQEIQMCSTECYLWCMVPEAGSSCNDRCTDGFRPFDPALAALRKTMAASGLAAPAKPHAPGKDDTKPFEACSEACNRKCAARASQGKTKPCGGSCAEACGLYAAATRVLQDAMPPAVVPSPAAVGDDTVANIFKACRQQCAANDNKCATKCAFAGYVVNKAKASMKLATGGFGLPA